MNMIAHYAARKAVKLHTENLKTRGAKPGDRSWNTARAVYKLTFQRIRILRSSFVAANHPVRLVAEDTPLLEVYTGPDGVFKHLRGTRHWGHCDS